MAETRVERRLAAILAADVVGYSRLMGQDEEGTLAVLKACQRDIIDPRIKEYRGRSVKTMGDGFLAEFASAVDAARCALDIQGAMARQNATISNDRRIDLRIGINVGDIIIDEGDVYGDGVNIAARVEPLADPGSVYLSENAYQQIRGKLALKVSELGKRQLKNNAQPIGILNMSPYPEQNYFADGMAEDIITGLSKPDALFVAARNSSFQYRGRKFDTKAIGRELGVQYLLEGSVRRAGNQVRINAQLIDTTTGGNLWAERCDGQLSDVFALQDKVTGRIIEALSLSLGTEERARLAGRGTTSIAAHDAFLRGQNYAREYTAESLKLAAQYYEQALKLDPDYERAKTALAQVRAIETFSGLE